MFFIFIKAIWQTRCPYKDAQFWCVVSFGCWLLLSLLTRRMTKEPKSALKFSLHTSVELFESKQMLLMFVHLSSSSGPSSVVLSGCLSTTACLCFSIKYTLYCMNKVAIYTVVSFLSAIKPKPTVFCFLESFLLF